MLGYCCCCWAVIGLRIPLRLPRGSFHACRSSTTTRRQLTSSSSSSDEEGSSSSRDAYLSSHPGLEDALKDALDEAVRANSPDPKMAIAASLSGGQGVGVARAGEGDVPLRLPPPSECPPEGAQCSGYTLPSDEARAYAWHFVWNHMINLPFFNEQVLFDVPAFERPQAAYVSE